MIIFSVDDKSYAEITAKSDVKIRGNSDVEMGTEHAKRIDWTVKYGD